MHAKSPCKVNLVLNILGPRPDGYHELETLLLPVPFYDDLHFQRGGDGIELTCDEPQLPVDSSNLVRQAATRFFEAAGLEPDVGIHLEKRIPREAGLAGGSANAAVTLTALNELYGSPLTSERLELIAASLGSDVPFFLDSRPALATGRGEKIQRLDPFPSMQDFSMLLIHPGFGIATQWAYRQLHRFSNARYGEQGRAGRAASILQQGDIPAAAKEFYNAFEAPAFEKFPFLPLLREWLLEQGAIGPLMSGSGSAIFAFLPREVDADSLAERLRDRFGQATWIAVVQLS